MASIIAAWVATHTGLPSLHVSGPGIVWAGNRVVAKLGAGTHLFCDPLAPAGTATKYRIGTSTATLTRRPESPAAVLVTDAHGRGLLTGFHDRNDDPVKWDAGATRFPSGAVRFPTTAPPETGETRLVLPNPGDLPALERAVRSRMATIIATPEPIRGLPAVRHVLVTSVARARRGVTGTLALTLTWESLPVPASGLAAPVVTWGEAESLGWQRLSAVGYARAIAGMP